MAEVTSCREKLLSNDYYDYIYSRDFDSGRGECRVSAGYGMGVYPQAAEQGWDYDNYYMLPKLFGLMDVGAAESMGALRAQAAGGLGLTGQGCLIGFIDTGIQYDNPVFADEYGRTRVVGIWDQSDQTGTPPEGLVYGSAYTREDILSGTEIGGDENGHGTYLASLAAGRADYANGFTGIAPDAMIAMVKLKPAKQYLRSFFLINKEAEAYQETDIMLGVRYLQNLAGSMEMPLVIVLGLGSSSGPHTGSDALSQLLDFASRRVGTAVVCAAGNEGDKRHHFFTNLDRNQDYADVEVRVGEERSSVQRTEGSSGTGETPDGEQGFTMELWGSPPDIYNLSVISPEGEMIPRITSSLGQYGRYEFLLSGTKVETGYRLLEFLNGDQLIFLRFLDPTPGIWRLRVSGRNLLSGSFHIWLPIEEFLSSDTYFLNPDPNTTITAPGNSDGPITLSGYDYRTGSLYIDSGRGYTARGNIKPELAAPAVDLTGVRASRFTEQEGIRYTLKSGTSAAAALCGGICAQFLQWGILQGRLPSMRTVEIKNLLIRGAGRQQNLIYPNREFGFGTVDIYNTFRVIANLD